jgi:Zonular occludens toxin (Zot)
LSVIAYLTGTPGMGKTSYATRAIGRALLEGRAVAGNVQLRDDFAEVVARHNFYALSSSSRRAVARDVRSRFFYTDELEQLTRVKLKGSGEARGLMILDEAHNELNNREWQSSESKAFLRWLSSVRHKGWRVLIVSQHADNTDKGARRIADREIRMVNLKQVITLPFVGAELLPWPVFRAYHYRLNEGELRRANGAAKRVRRETFLLGWWRRLFDTHELADEDEPGAIWLPRVGEASGAGVAGAVPLELVLESDPSRVDVGALELSEVN